MGDARPCNRRKNDDLLESILNDLTMRKIEPEKAKEMMADLLRKKSNGKD